MKKAFLATAALAIATALLPASAQEPQTDLPRVKLSAGMYQIDAQVAQTTEQRMTGLMFRKEMPQQEGMLFVFEQPSRQCFWMKNTLLPLDMIFIKPDGTILSIAERTVPMTETPVPSHGSAKAVLEVNGGTASRLGIKPGDKVTASALAK